MVDYMKMSRELANATTIEEMSAFCKDLNIIRFPRTKLPLNLSFYRARLDDGFDKNDKTQFGYIQDATKVGIGRYNLAHEQVLYTSTNPKTAFMEVRSHNDTNPKIASVEVKNKYYISVWRKKDQKGVMTSLAYNPNCCKPNSNASKYNKDLGVLLEYGEKSYGTGYKDFVKDVGKKMETDSTYEFSSFLASELLKNNEALLTVSARSEERELNVTFNKRTVNNRLELSFVLHGDEPKENELWMKVDEVGIVKDEKVIWKKNVKMIECNNPFLEDLLSKVVPLVGLRISSDENKERLICESGDLRCEYELE